MSTRPAERIRDVIGSDVGVEIERHRITSATDGPRLVVFGGVHGDECEGVLAASMVLDGVDTMRSGELHVIPRANPRAVAAQRRETPDDGGNLARSFPGDPAGTYTERVAHVLSEQVLRGADAFVDLHSGGTAYAMPFFAGYVAGVPTTDRAAEMCAAFGAPITWCHDAINPGRSLTTAADLGVPAIYAEGGNGGSSLCRDEVIGYVDGVRRVMAALGLLDADDVAPAPARRGTISGGDGNTDESIVATRAGRCITAVRRGEAIEAGRLVAEIRDADGRLIEEIRAGISGTVMMIRHTSAIEVGDGVVMLSPHLSDVPRPIPGSTPTRSTPT